MGLGAADFLKVFLVWEAHGKDTAVSMAVSYNKVSRSYRKEQKLLLVLGICPVPQEAATYPASLSPSSNKTLTASEQKQNCKDSVQKKSFFCTLPNMQL